MDPETHRETTALTTEELLVLELIAEGADRTEIAETIGISANAADDLIGSVVEKMSAPSPSEAAVRALRAGLIGPQARLQAGDA